MDAEICILNVLMSQYENLLMALDITGVICGNLRELKALLRRGCNCS